MAILRAVAITAIASVALPALAGSQPTRFTYRMTLDPLERNTFAIGRVPRGEFAFTLRASSDGDKNLTLTQQRNGGARFPVLVLPGGAGSDGCEGAAGTLVCTGITTPATPAGKTWTFRVRNRSARPMSVTLTIAWRKVAAAG